MELHNSGVKIEVYDQNQLTWVPLVEIYLEEAKQYNWRVITEENIRLLMQNIPLPMIKSTNGWEGVFETPFQSGVVAFTVQGNEGASEIESFVYPDTRKLTSDQYDSLLKEILEEATICFQLSGLEKDIDTKGFSRELSMLQWSYIENSFAHLKNIFTKIRVHPIRVLRKESRLLQRERVKHVTPITISWIEKYGETYGGTPTKHPTHIQSIQIEETYDVYENRVLLAQIIELQTLLKKYKVVQNPAIQRKAIHFDDLLSRWRKEEFLQNLKPHYGTIKISQAFRKHPMYRLWFKWFQALYEFKEISFDFGNRLSLKDTYALYEMWCFIQIIKCLRELELVNDYQSMFTVQDGYFFLNLAEHKESTIKLKNGALLTYQKVIQSNSNPNYTYTHRMIPDIVIEYKGKMFVLDPKYRVETRLPMALGEMHKYRDGILNRETQERVVEEVYILTPIKETMPNEKDFYNRSFHTKYQMGAFCFAPGGDLSLFKEWLVGIFSDFERNTVD